MTKDEFDRMVAELRAGKPSKTTVSANRRGPYKRKGGRDDVPFVNYHKDDPLGRDNREEDDRIRARDLKTNEVPSSRDGKRHNDRVRWRGEQFTDDAIKAIYQTPNDHNKAIVHSGEDRFTDSPRDERHCPESFRAV
jgi:hypothetical protein